MRNTKHFAPFQRIVLAYLLVALLWVLVSDRVVELLLPHDLQHVAQTWKGWFFVAVTTGLLYVLLRRVHRQMSEAAERELETAQAQARSATLLNSLLNSSGDVIFAKDRQGRYTVFNAEAERLVSKAAEDMLGADDRAIFPAEQAAAIMAHDQAVMAGGKLVQSEDTLSTIEGPVVFNAIKGPLRNEDGVFGVFGIARNVTETVRMREALRASERCYRQVFEASPLAMWVQDAQARRFLDVNTAAVVQYGYSREQFLGMKLQDLQPSADLAAEHLLFSEGESVPVPAGEAGGSHLHRCQDGRVIEVELSSCAIDFDGHPAQLTLGVDVSMRNRLQRERDASHRNLASVLSRVTDAFVAIDRSQRLTYANERAARWFSPGVPAQEMLGRLVWDLVPEAVGTVFQEAVLQALDSGQPTAAEDWFQPWQRWMELRMYPSPQGATAYFTDVSERRNSEEALRQSQRELSELSHQLLHQEQAMHQRLAQSLHDRLGQQLGSARLYVDVLKAQVAPPLDAADRLAGALDAAIAEVRDVLRDMRPPLLIEQGLPAALENELLHSPAQALGMTAELHIGPWLVGQRWSDDVEYAFFMIAREAIANAVRHARAQRVTVHLDGDARRLSLRVRDDGVGLLEAARSGQPGHLGLVGMRERAVAIGAVLSVVSPHEGGTTVDIALEVDDAPDSIGAPA